MCTIVIAIYRKQPYCMSHYAPQQVPMLNVTLCLTASSHIEFATVCYYICIPRYIRLSWINPTVHYIPFTQMILRFRIAEGNPYCFFLCLSLSLSLLLALPWQRWIFPWRPGGSVEYLHTSPRHMLHLLPKWLKIAQAILKRCQALFIYCGGFVCFVPSLLLLS